MAYALRRPEPDADSAPFWAGCAAGRLLGQRCEDCGAWRFPPRPMCPTCQSLRAVWDELAGTGTIWSFVVPHPPLLPGYSDLAPYPVVVVELDEHPSLRLVGNVVSAPGAAINSVDPASLAIGQRVRATFETITEPDDDQPIGLVRWVRID